MNFFGNGCFGGGFQNREPDNCGCGCDPCTLILILLLLSCCGCGNGFDCCSLLWIILLLSICGGYGCGCGDRDYHGCK